MRSCERYKHCIQDGEERDKQIPANVFERTCVARGLHECVTGGSEVSNREDDSEEGEERVNWEIEA